MDVDSSDEEGAHGSLTKSEGAFLILDKDPPPIVDRDRGNRDRDDRLSHSENSLDGPSFSGTLSLPPSPSLSPHL